MNKGSGDESNNEILPCPVEITYGSLSVLRETLSMHFGEEVGLPNLHQSELCLLDEAIKQLKPPVVRVRVVEVDTFMESERSIVKGDVPLDEGHYALRQARIVLKRVEGCEDSPEAAADKESPAADEESPAADEGVGQSEKADSKVAEPADAVAEESETLKTTALADHASDKGGMPWREYPEIILFWGRNRRSGGQLVVCPYKSMDRLIEAYMVCEVVENTNKINRGKLITEHEGALMGVELGESLPAEQDTLENLVGDYSFHDAAVGTVSLVASIYYFGFLKRNDVNVLTLLAVAVVAGLNQEATWPWVFKQILRCSQIKDPIVRVSQCRRVHNHVGQLSGQSFLAIGLAVFGVYLEVFPADDGDTPLLFRILLNVFLGGMMAVLVVNMVQAVEPMANLDLRPRDRLKPWARKYLENKVFDTVWYLTLLVTLVWAAVIAVTVLLLPYNTSENIAWSCFIACLVIATMSLVTVNPGMALLGAWGLVWLIPTGLAFVLRSSFDMMSMVINRVNLVSRRMAREVHAHVRTSMKGAFSVRDILILLLQVLPLTPLLLIFLPIPMLYIFTWFLHTSLRLSLILGDAIIQPVSCFRLYPLLSDYGSVSWKLGRLSMDVEKTSMKTLLKRRVAKLMEESTLGKRMDSGVWPAKPYEYLRKVSSPRLGCIAVLTADDEDSKKKLSATRKDISHV